jgi:hypothetical protein
MLTVWAAKELPMNNDHVSQTQQIANLWFELWDEQTSRAINHAQTAIEESARIAKESIAYQQKLAAEWRKIVLGKTGN